MSKSLKDQLLALGLAKPPPAGKKSDKPAKGRVDSKNRSRHDSRRKVVGKKAAHRAGTQGDGKQGAGSEPSLADAFRLREQQTKQESEKAKELKRQEERRRRELNKEIRSIVEPNRLNSADAELTRNFMYKGRIRKVNVTAEQFAGLNDGSLGLVYLAGGYHVLASEWVSKVTEMAADKVPELSGGDEEDDEFPVPDDLIW
jgi:uncharacterized protein YaiL (DUF2058 family)